MGIKEKIKRIDWLIANQIGVDIRKLSRLVLAVPIYMKEVFIFKKSYKGKMLYLPCLHDRYEEAGVTKTEYFWQDLLVARWIHSANPASHLDIGSRIDGFVAHIASFRELVVLDVRAVTKKIPGISFKQADLMKSETIADLIGKYDSVSCLHALEHFGLGRYGDSVNPEGYKLGLTNIGSLLKSGGVLYLSTPIGEERVEFNANWIFSPYSIIEGAKKAGLELEKLQTISKGQHISDVKLSANEILRISKEKYNLGLFLFRKI